MKKLVFTMGCVIAIALMSSCTTDSVDDIQNQNSKTSNQISTLATEATTVAIDDKDKTKT